MKEKFCYSFDEEIYNGSFDTREDALAEALSEAYDDHEFCYTAACKPFVPSVNINTILEDVNENARSHGGEYAEDYPNLSKEEKQELSKIMNEALVKFLIETKNMPHFYGVEKVEYHKIEKELP